MTPSKEPMVSFEQREEVCVGIIHTARMLDALNVVEFGNQLVTHANDLTVKNVLLDFQHVAYLSSAVLTELLRLNHILVERGGSVRLCGLAATLREVFKITALDSVFVIYEVPSTNEAVTRFKRSLAVSEHERAWEQLAEEA